MGNLLQKCILSIACSQGNKEVKRVAKFSAEDDITVTRAKATAGFAGFHIDGDKGGTLTLEVFDEDDPEIDYDKMQRTKEIHSWAMQPADGAGLPVGQRERLLVCLVAKTTKPIETDGKFMRTITIEYGFRVPG